jgi:hypothetical protein
MTITPEDLVRREVAYCCSSLVSTLANAPDATFSQTRAASGSVTELCEQAMNLCAPIDDWEEGAKQEGWKQSTSSPEYFNAGNPGDPMLTVKYTSWQDLCEDYGIEPYQREVYEHWIVSDWLANKLEEHGEKVDKDFRRPDGLGSHDHWPGYCRRFGNRAHLHRSQPGGLSDGRP